MKDGDYYMNNILRREQSTLVNLAQIEGGFELLERVKELQNLVNQIDLSKYRLKEHYITESDLSPTVTKNIFNDILNSILNSSGSIKTLDDILLDMQNIKIILDTCKKYDDPLSDGEIESISEHIIIELTKIVQYQLEEEKKYYNERINDVLSDIDIKINEVIKNNDRISFQMGDMNELHPFLLEALGPNNTVTDAINFLFQMIIDSKSYGEDLPENISNMSYPSRYEGERVEYGDLPKVFTMPEDMGEVGRYSKTDDIEELEDNDFGSISERIMYRKTMRKIDKND